MPNGTSHGPFAQMAVDVCKSGSDADQRVSNREADVFTLTARYKSEEFQHFIVEADNSARFCEKSEWGTCEVLVFGK